jgi:hypothetical protein
MTNKEREKLIEDLLLMADAHHYGPLYKRAADEIERLAAFVELQQSVLYAKTDEIERLAGLIEDYKLIFGDIHEIKVHD